ncbi:hypothetical protein MIND_01432900 [Mycena indigotica]|uniref:Uncharacterized protein n=1 Tax=Mycena indigotica TaxID=2126181 RepID=A0A8H6VU94_9AGAR|nr:uncharacterized protein MIND_01432900 [Mycena indigotica]KAF7288459.1 hypothetical protein MIND_01432900 [Mycena indigotica]
MRCPASFSAGSSRHRCVVRVIDSGSDLDQGFSALTITLQHVRRAPTSQIPSFSGSRVSLELLQRIQRPRSLARPTQSLKAGFDRCCEPGHAEALLATSTSEATRPAVGAVAVPPPPFIADSSSSSHSTSPSEGSPFCITRFASAHICRFLGPWENDLIDKDFHGTRRTRHPHALDLTNNKQ